MDRESRFRRPNTPAGAFQRADGYESTRVARVVTRPSPEPVPAHELARVHDADELGVELYVSGEHPLPAPEGEPGALPLPVEIPLSRPRSLIPDDILEAIAAEEAALLAEEAQAEQEAFDDAYGDDDDDALLELDDGELEVVSELAESDEVRAVVRGASVLQDLPADALELLLPGAVRHRLTDRQPAFREGEAAESFFVVERGVLEAMRLGGEHELALMHVHAGEAFGLFGLLTHRVREATVRAIGDASVLELRAAGLDAVARRFPEARQVLARFFKERLLENFLAVSPIFRDLDAVGRAALISHFQDRKVAAGEVLLAPGEVQNGIALVTSGHLVVTRREGPGRDVQVARLSRGHYYGVVSALSGLPTRASISAPEPSTLCVLPPKAFNEFVKGYPVLRSLPARLHEAGERVERDVFVGDATQLD